MHEILDMPAYAVVSFDEASLLQSTKRASRRPSQYLCGEVGDELLFHDRQERGKPHTPLSGLVDVRD